MKKSRLFLVFLILVMIVFTTALLSTVPSAHAASNANLFVSAENSQWNNYFAGPQVIQVVVNDPDIQRLDQAYGEPTVTVNGKKLRMTQATDGNWYAYFADSKQAQQADSTVGLAGKGLDFGTFCSPASASGNIGVTFAETKGFAIATTGSSNGHANPASATISTDCSAIIPGSFTIEHVIKENKTMTHPNGAVTLGQLGYKTTTVWPIIQLYDFSAIPSTVVVDYQKAGGDQIVNLTFDKIPTGLISAIRDRIAYPPNSQVFITVNDPQLNIDPTEEDSWTWGANAANNTLFYQAFNRTGGADADGTSGMQNLKGNLTYFMFNHNGKLTINPTAQLVRVIDFQQNGKQLFASSARGDPAIVRTNSTSAGSEPITLTEQGGVNTGVFGNWDGGKKSNIVTVDDANIRGQSASVRYNDVSTSIVGGFAFGSINMSGTFNIPTNPWPSGQKASIALTDNDLNLNSKVPDNLNLYDPNVKSIPTLKIGTPFSLSSGNPISPKETASLSNKITFTTVAQGISNLSFSGGKNATASNLAKDEQLSFRPIFRFANTTVGQPVQIGTESGIFIDLNTTAQTLFNTIHSVNRIGNTENFKGFNFINYDLRSFSFVNYGLGPLPSLPLHPKISNVGIYLVYNPSGNTLTNAGLPTGTLTAISVANSTLLQDFINLNTTNTANVFNPATVNKNIFNIPKTTPIGLLFKFTTQGGPLTLSTSNAEPVVADFFSIGIKGNGLTNDQRINNGIYRFELQETGGNTGVFTGTNEYTLLNQLNIFDQNTYSTLKPISSDVKFVAIQDMLQSENSAPQITYQDLGADGQITPWAVQQDILTHTGVISFDSKTYKVGDTAVITLNDPDLSVDNSIVNVYSVVNQPTDVASNTVGKSGLGTYLDVSPFGSLLDVKFDGIRWDNTACFSGSETPGGFSTNLYRSSFTLVESSPGSGIFTGTFLVPDQFCFNPTKAISTFGATVSADYFDFVDSKSKTNYESDSAVIGDQQTIPSKDNHVLFQSGFFTPQKGIDSTGITNSAQNDVVHFLIQFYEPPGSREMKIMEKQGITFLEYVTGNAYIVSSNVSAVNLLSGNQNIRWAGPMQSNYKISNDIVNNKIPIWANAKNNQAILTIILHKDANLTESFNHMSQLGSNIVMVKEFPSISGYFDLNNVNKIANDDNVQYIDFVDPGLVAANDMARQNSGVKILHDSSATNPVLLGDFVTIFEYDVGVADPFHPALSAILNKVPASESWKIQPHSTHVAGTLVGDGSNSDCANLIQTPCPPGSNSFWQGMAPNAKLISLGESAAANSNNDFLYNDFTDLTDKFEIAKNIQIPDLVSMSLASSIGNTGSFSDCANLSKYPAAAKYLDEIVTGTLGMPFIFFEAAGNEHKISSDCNSVNYYSIDPPATAKNIITVGGIYASDNKTEDLSSLGPTSDDRIKPDIVAPGARDSTTGLISTWPNTSGIQSPYKESSGTSMATPVAAGATALLIQEWRLPSSGYTTNTPMPATVKAILIHTANNPNGIGPDYSYGWGILNAVSAVNLVRDNNTNNSIHMGQVTANSPQSFNFDFSGPSGSDVKATLVWDDPPGDPSTFTHELKNNLDVQLIDSNHVFDQSFICKNTLLCHEQGTDTKNNVKMVVGHGSPGMWTANVIGTSIPLGHQDFTLIVTTYTPTSISPPTITSPNNGAIASTNPILVQGSGIKGATVLVRVNGEAPSITQVHNDGSWSVPVQLDQATNTIYATQRISSSDSLDSNTVTVLTTMTSPQPPTGLTAHQMFTSQIVLDWTAPSNNGGSQITGYKIERSSDGGSTWSLIEPNTHSQLPQFTNVGLSSGTFTYRVYAINAMGLSSSSNTATVTMGPPCVGIIPQPPTGLFATLSPPSQIDLRWTAPSNSGCPITGYKIERSSDTGLTWPWSTVTNTTPPPTTFPNTGLSSGTYIYRVSAINAAGTSAPSTISNAVTLLVVPEFGSLAEFVVIIALFAVIAISRKLFQAQHLYPK